MSLRLITSSLKNEAGLLRLLQMGKIMNAPDSVEKYEFRHACDTPGQLESTLIVHARIPLLATSEGFNQEKRDELLQWAEGVTKQHQVRMEFWSVG